MPYFDRFDLVEAWYLCLQDWSHWNVSPSVEYYRLGKMQTYFHPSPSLSYENLSENGQAIYDQLNARYETRKYSPNWPMPRGEVAVAA
jgi:hypothetical protein